MAIRPLDLALVLLTSLSAYAGDVGEPNQTCPTAWVTASGTYFMDSADYWSTTPPVESTDWDYYRVTLQPGERLDFTCTRTGDMGNPADLLVSPHDATSGCPGGWLPGGFQDNGTFTVQNTTSVPRVIVVLMYAWLHNEGWAEISYRLDVLISGYGCTGPGDSLEPNSSEMPRRLTPNVRTGLTVGSTPYPSGPAQWDDVYAVRVPPGATIDARITFVHTNGDLDLLLYTSGGGIVATSATTADVEQASHTNLGGSVEEYWVAVRSRPGVPNICNTYQLEVAVNDPAIGANYCVSAPNSTQNGASLRAFGSISLGNPLNTLDFVVEGLPPNVPCLLYYGSATTQVPFGDGFRCVAGTTFREALVFADAIGEAIVPFDPASNQPAGVVTPGSTWHFQAYYRNVNGPLGSGFNLSDGYTITFLP